MTVYFFIEKANILKIFAFLHIPIENTMNRNKILIPNDRSNEEKFKNLQSFRRKQRIQKTALSNSLTNI
jgi:hypothetical protein